jgi:hypothetical protein
VFDDDILDCDHSVRADALRAAVTSALTHPDDALQMTSTRFSARDSLSRRPDC